MTIYEKLKSWLESRVSHAYVMGGTGQPCTPSYRKARAAQYPASAGNIKKYCQVLSGKKSTCDGCKYQGKRAYDCAQLTRWAANHVGIKLVSGATSQWKKTEWGAKGEIDSLPSGKMCMVFRQDDRNTMGHVGWYMGDGTVVHARGHSYGVVRTPVNETKWTHWGIPVQLYKSEATGEEKPDFKARLEAVIQELELLLDECNSSS